MAVNQKKVSIEGKYYRLNWSGIGFHPEEYGCVRKTVLNNKGQIYCPTCCEFKDFDEYYHKSDGTPLLPCRECKKDYQRQWKNSKGKKKQLYILRMKNSGNYAMANIAEMIPDTYFENGKFSIGKVPVDIFPDDYREYAEKLGAGKGLERRRVEAERAERRQKREEKKKRRPPKAKRIHVCNDRVKVKGTFSLLKREKHEGSEETVECPVCEQRLPMTFYKTRHSYCCNACDSGLRAATESERRREVPQLLDKYEETSERMYESGVRGDTETFLALRKELDFLRVKIDTIVHWNRGNHADIYTIPV